MANEKLVFSNPGKYTFYIPPRVKSITAVVIGGGGGAACITEEDNDGRDRNKPQTGDTGGYSNFLINGVEFLRAEGGTGGKAYWNTDSSGHEYTNGWYAHSEKGIGGNPSGNDGLNKITRENVIELLEGGYGFSGTADGSIIKDGYGQGGSIEDVGRTSGEGHDVIRIVGSGGSGGFNTKSFDVNPGDIISGNIGAVGKNMVFNDSQVSSKNYLGKDGAVIITFNYENYESYELVNPTDVIINKNTTIKTNFIHKCEHFGFIKFTTPSYNRDGLGVENMDMLNFYTDKNIIKTEIIDTYYKKFIKIYSSQSYGGKKISLFINNESIYDGVIPKRTTADVNYDEIMVPRIGRFPEDIDFPIHFIIE